MAVYQVCLKDRRGSGASARGARIFIADRFSWSAALVTPLWAVSHGLWLELIMWIASVILLGALSLVIGGDAVFWLYVVLSVLIGFEAQNLRARALVGKGWYRAGDFIAPSAEQAEMGWLERDLRT